jgi:hypothetical protein
MDMPEWGRSRERESDRRVSGGVNHTVALYLKKKKHHSNAQGNTTVPGRREKKTYLSPQHSHCPAPSSISLFPACTSFNVLCVVIIDEGAKRETTVVEGVQ